MGEVRVRTHKTFLASAGPETGSDQTGRGVDELCPGPGAGPGTNGLACPHGDRRDSQLALQVFRPTQRGLVE